MFIIEQKKVYFKKEVRDKCFDSLSRCGWQIIMEINKNVIKKGEKFDGYVIVQYVTYFDDEGELENE